MQLPGNLYGFAPSEMPVLALRTGDAAPFTQAKAAGLFLGHSRPINGDGNAEVFSGVSDKDEFKIIVYVLSRFGNQLFQ